MIAVVAEADEVVVAAVMTTTMTIAEAVQADEVEVAAVMTTMMMIVVAAQADEVVAAAVMTMMMTIVVAVQADEVEVAAVMTTMIMMAAVKTRVIKNVMPTDVLRLKQNVLKTKEAFASFVFSLLTVFTEGEVVSLLQYQGIQNRLTKKIFSKKVSS